MKNAISFLDRWGPLIVGVIAVLAATYIHYDTIKYIRPFEKPILVVDDATVKSELLNNGDAKIDLVLVIKNYGRGIAQDTKIKIYYAPLNQAEIIELITNKTIANDIYPGVTFYRTVEFVIPASNVNKTTRIVQLEEETRRLGFVIRLDYLDKVTKKGETQISWVGYEIGRGSGFHLTIDEKNTLLPWYEKLV